MKIDWKRKLTSRKFWAAVAGFITTLCVAFKIDTMTTEQIVAVVSALGVLVAYIIGETVLDNASIKSNEISKNDEEIK